MEENTKNGLLLILIGQIIGIITLILFGLFQFFVSIQRPEDFLQYILFGVIGGISGLISLIGAILFFIGRKEFDENHQKFVTYAVICLVVGIVFTVIISFVNSFLFRAFGVDGNSLSSLSVIILLPTIISAITGGLTYVFALYHLEDDTGRKLLYLAFFVSVIVSVMLAFVSSGTIDQMLQDLSNDPEDFTAISSSISTITQNSAINLISAALWCIAVYLPYKRIKDGDLKPQSVQLKGSSLDRVCPQCNRSIPDDANICPYCGKGFETYL